MWMDESIHPPAHPTRRIVAECRWMDGLIHPPTDSTRRIVAECGWMNESIHPPAHSVDAWMSRSIRPHPTIRVVAECGLMDELIHPPAHPTNADTLTHPTGHKAHGRVPGRMDRLIHPHSATKRMVGCASGWIDLSIHPHSTTTRLVGCGRMDRLDSSIHIRPQRGFVDCTLVFWQMHSVGCTWS